MGGTHASPPDYLRLLAAGDSLVDLTLGLLSSSGDSLGSLVSNLLSLLLGVNGNLLDLRSVAESEEEGDNSNNRDENGDKTSNDLRDELDGLDGVLLGNGEEEVDLLLDVVDGVLKEVELSGRSGVLGKVLGLLSISESLLDGVLELEGLLGKLGSVLDGVTDVDVVEEDIALHGPDLEANL